MNDDLPPKERELRARQWDVGFELLGRNQELHDLRRTPPHRRTTEWVYDWTAIKNRRDQLQGCLEALS